jgi:large subunit ribosomal protein L7/L12
MGFLRKTILIGTGGLAPIKANSYRERTAKAAEKQVKLLSQQQAAAPASATTLPSAATTGGVEVILTASGEKKIAIIKIIMEATGFGLREAKQLVDHPPAVVLAGVSEEVAAALKTRIEQQRGQAELRGIPEQDGPAVDLRAADEATSLASELERFASLHDRGALTDEEFTEAKKRALG